MRHYVADQAFKNAMKAGDINGAAAAIKFAALERNTPLVGVKSPQCTDTASMSPEIASIISHQVLYQSELPKIASFSTMASDFSNPWLTFGLRRQ